MWLSVIQLTFESFAGGLAVADGQELPSFRIAARFAVDGLLRDLPL